MNRRGSVVESTVSAYAGSGAPPPQYAQQPFREALTDLKRRRCLSYRQLAYLTGLSPGYLSHLCKGNRLPHEGTLRVLAHALRVRPEYFREYRFSLLVAELEARPEVVDTLYEHFIARATPLVPVQRSTDLPA